MSDTEHNKRYGYSHRRRRTHYKHLVQSGQATCWRCGHPIHPGSDFDVGHKDGGGPTEYMGPEHIKCNRGASNRRPTAPTVDTSRNW